jgi:hypothetical protein
MKWASEEETVDNIPSQYRLEASGLLIHFDII